MLAKGDEEDAVNGEGVGGELEEQGRQQVQAEQKISLKNTKNLDGCRGEAPNTRGLDSEYEPCLPVRLFS